MVVLLEPGHRLDLHRAPDVSEACREAYGDSSEPTLLSLPELLGVLSAHQWQEKRVPIPTLGAHIHPRYGVFSPVRSKYVDLVDEAPLPEAAGDAEVFDLGTGTGVLAAVIARRGVAQVIATDITPRAVVCAMKNVQRLGLQDRVTVLEADLYPPGRADLVVCNPSAAPQSGRADEADRGGRARGRRQPVHGTPSPRAKDPHDLLHAACSQESTTLLRLRPMAIRPPAGAGGDTALTTAE